jgi:hypothetical protein
MLSIRTKGDRRLTVPRARSIIRDDGQQYASGVEAARYISVQPARISEAAEMTRCGFYYAVKNHQFAYSDCVPEVWPASTGGAKPAGEFPIVRSDGREYRIMFEAAKDIGVKAREIAKVVELSRFGVYRKVADYYFAHSDSVPEVWSDESPGPPEPVKQEKPEKPAESVRVPIYPEIPSEEWRPIPGLSGYEASIYGHVREIGSEQALPRQYYQHVALVVIDGRRYSIPVLLMLTFVGLKPYGYNLVKCDGRSNELSNLAYAPTKAGRRKNSD